MKGARHSLGAVVKVHVAGIFLALCDGGGGGEHIKKFVRDKTRIVVFMRQFNEIDNTFQ